MNSTPPSSQRLVDRLATTFERFLRANTSGGIVLIGATVLALALATTLGGAAIDAVWERKLSLGVGRFTLQLSWQHWVNDGLMALFFLLVGLELKRELLVGELARPREALLPALAALGGMIVPAIIFLLFNFGRPSSHGWGVPMATDIAFAVGVLALLGSRVPRSLVVFLTALAIVDDLGAVLVIALVYTSTIDVDALAAAGALFAVLIALSLCRVRALWVYAVVGAGLWVAMLLSGVHATIAGVLLAAAIPARSLGGESPLERLEHGLGRWVTFGIVPLFALANAGIDLGAVAWGRALTEPVTLGVVLGLLLGKALGVSLFAWGAVRLGLARLPADMAWQHLVGAALLAGIGFTMSLFIAQLAFGEARMVEAAKLGILLGSLASAVLGLAWLASSLRSRSG